MMNNIVGQPVENDDFFNREAEVHAVWESLEQGNHVLLLAPRRVGKTSLALRVGQRARQAGWRFAFVDGAYDNATAMSFLQELGESKGIETRDEVCAAILRQVGWPLPFYLQLVFHRLYAGLGRPARQPGVADVERAIRELSRPDFYKHFEPWRGRLAEGLGPAEHQAAVAVLNALCQQPDGLPRQALRDDLASRFREPSQAAQLLSTVLGLLERDGYLMRVDGEGDSPTRYAFRSFLLRKYWYVREVE